MPVQTTIKLRRGTAAQWTAANPVLSAGEMGIETDTNRSKYGDGTTAWASLSYSVGDSSGVGTIDWNSVLNKPTEFAPTTHAASHGIGGSDEIEVDQAQVYGLLTSLAGKSDVVHTHVKTDITDFAHTHLLADITDYTPPVIPEVTFTNTFMLMGA